MYMSYFKYLHSIFYQKLVNLAPKWNKFSHPHVQIIVTPLTLIKSVAENMVPLS